MNIVTKINHYVKKNAISLGAVFLIFMNIIVLITIISMSAHFMQTSKELLSKSNEERQVISKSIANIIYSTAKEGIATGNYAVLDEVSRKLIDNRLINFVIVYDIKHPNKVIWSSIDERQKGKTIPVNIAAKIYSQYSPYESQLLIERGNVAQKINVVIAYTIDTNLTYYIKSVASKNPALAVIFILLGSFCSLLMIKLITVPIQNMTDSIKIFSKGNFKHKIPTTYYKELNILTRAFNEMASIIYKTHTSLEEKIKERTVEITEKNQQLSKAMNDLKETQAMLVHGEKMRSLGELVAGITHEINNPVNFIYGNLTHLNNYTQDLMDIIDKYKEYNDLLPEDKKAEMEKLLEDREYDYLKDDLPDLIKSCREGTVRTKNIVMDLKDFSRTEKMVINAIDVNKEINTTLNILYNKYKNRIEIHKELGNIPTLDCYGGQINQVLMNIIDNAIFAIKETGDIYIRTNFDGTNIIIEIEDTGVGISKENIEKVFEPFFTTKGVGEGTGLGMSISYKIIESHHGKIDIDSEVGRGTKFTITLPKDGLKNEQEEA